MHDVVVYLSSIHKQTPGRKIDTLRAFAEGAKKCGANVHIESQHVFRPAKLAVILGWPSPISTMFNTTKVNMPIKIQLVNDGINYRMI